MLTHGQGLTPLTNPLKYVQQQIKGGYRRLKIVLVHLYVSETKTS